MDDQTSRTNLNNQAPDEHQARLDALQEIQNAGLSPWPEAQQVTTTCAQVRKHFEETSDSLTVYALAGRIMAKRDHGKSLFATIRDRSGDLQIYGTLQGIGEELFKLLVHSIHVGDIIQVTGTLFRTRTGEITLQVQSYTFLSKCLHPLPEKFHGLTDREVCYRQRYLDLMVHPETKERFVARARAVNAIREYLDSHEFVEVETPMLHPIPGGAAARPFVTHHNALDTELYLRIAPELYLKRLVIGGIERVYEINRNFRNEGLSTRHNPEFTMLEYYQAHGTYEDGMRSVEELFRHVAQKVAGQTAVPFGDHVIDFGAPFLRLTPQEALLHYGVVTNEELAPEALDATLKKHGVNVSVAASYAVKVFALFEECAEKFLVQPTFIIHFPIEVSPLSKRLEGQPDKAARFELYVAGMELSNGFSELNDPFDQAQRFKDQVDARAAGDAEAMYFDADYIKALEYGLPPTVGVGVGIDRLVMILTNSRAIRDVILFPTLRKLPSE